MARHRPTEVHDHAEVHDHGNWVIEKVQVSRALPVADKLCGTSTGGGQGGGWRVRADERTGPETPSRLVVPDRLPDALPDPLPDALPDPLPDPASAPEQPGPDQPGADAGPDLGRPAGRAERTGFDLRDPAVRERWLAWSPERRREALAAGRRRAYTQALDWAAEAMAAGRGAVALTVVDELLAVSARAPFAQADALRVLRRVPPAAVLDVPPDAVGARARATLDDVRVRPELLRVVPDLLRLVARVLFALGDAEGVLAVARLARDEGARLARGYAEGPLERLRDDMALAPMWAVPGYTEVFSGLPPPVFTDAEVAVRMAEHVRHLRLRRPQRLPTGMDRLVAVEVVELDGAGDTSTVEWLTWLAGRPSLHTLELNQAAQRLGLDERLLAALLVAPGLRRLRIGYPTVNPWSMRALMADLRATGAPPRTRLLQLALLRGDMDYVLARARTADLVTALDSRVAGVRGAALHLLEGVFGAPPVRFAEGDDVLVVGHLEDGELLALRLGRIGVRLSRERGPRTRLGVVAERHDGRALDLLDGELPLICEGQLRALLDRRLDRLPAPDGAAPELRVPEVAGSAVSRALASTDGVTVGAALERLAGGRAARGAFEGLIVVATNPRLDRTLRQTARRLLLRDAPADLVDAASDVAEIVRALDRTGSLSTWDLQETGIETDGLVDVVELAVLLLRVRQARRLDVVNAGLVAMPPAVLELTGLNDLSLAGNRLTRLPAELAGLTALDGLDLGHNLFPDLPPVLAALGRLRRLNLAADGDPTGEHAAWPGLAVGLGALSQLRELVLDGHRLARLPDAVRRMGALERLSLRRGRLDELPGWLAELPRLGWLALDGTPIADPAAARQVITALRARGVVVSAWPTESS